MHAALHVICFNFYVNTFTAVIVLFEKSGLGKVQRYLKACVCYDSVRLASFQLSLWVFPKHASPDLILHARLQKSKTTKTQAPSFFFFQHCIQHLVKITVAPNALNEYAFMVEQPPESLSCRCKKVILKQQGK